MKAEGATSGLARQDDKQRQRCTRFLQEHKAIDGPSEETIGQDHGEEHNANGQNPEGLTIATQRHKP